MTFDFGRKDTFGAGFVKFDKFDDFGDLRKFIFDFLNCIGWRKFTAVENFVDVADNTDGFFGETGAFETDNIDHFDPAVASFGSHKGRNVF